MAHCIVKYMIRAGLGRPGALLCRGEWPMRMAAGDWRYPCQMMGNNANSADAGPQATEPGYDLIKTAGFGMAIVTYWVAD